MWTLSSQKVKKIGFLVFYSINGLSSFSDTPAPKTYLLLQKSVLAEMLAVGVTSSSFEKLLEPDFRVRSSFSRKVVMKAAGSKAGPDGQNGRFSIFSPK